MSARPGATISASSSGSSSRFRASAAGGRVGARLSRAPAARVPDRGARGARGHRDRRDGRSGRGLSVLRARRARSRRRARGAARLRSPVHAVRAADRRGRGPGRFLDRADRPEPRHRAAALAGRARPALAPPRAARRVPRAGDHRAARSRERGARRALRLARRPRAGARGLRERARAVGRSRPAPRARSARARAARATPNGEALALCGRRRRQALLLDGQRRGVLVSQRARPVGLRDAGAHARRAARVRSSGRRGRARLVVLSAPGAARAQSRREGRPADGDDALGGAARHAARRRARAAPAARRAAADPALAALLEPLAVLRARARVDRRRAGAPAGRCADRAAVRAGGGVGRDPGGAGLALRVVPRGARAARRAGPRARLAGGAGSRGGESRPVALVVHADAGRLLPDRDTLACQRDPHQRRLPLHHRQPGALGVVPVRQRAGARARPVAVQGRVPVPPRRRRASTAIRWRRSRRCCPRCRRARSAWAIGSAARTPSSCSAPVAATACW